MKKKIDKKIITIIVLFVVLIGIVIAYLTDFSISSIWQGSTSNTTDTTTTVCEEAKVINIENVISMSGEIASTLEEQVELHATYYFEEIYVQSNQYVKEGEKLLKYTNGTYLLAPYNCIVTELSIPDEEGQCTSKHYITVKATDSVKMALNIDESKINTVYVGQEAHLYVESLDKTYSGYVTKVSSTASNGKFSLNVEFKNDGDIKIGMSGKCSVVLEKAESVIAIPVEAVTTTRGTSYVSVVDNSGNVSQVQVTTGISNDAYIEVKEEITEGTTVQYSK